MTAHGSQSPLNVRDRLSYAELEIKFIRSCEAVSESGRELESWYSFLMKELYDIQLDRVKEQLRETQLELKKCKLMHLEEIKQLKLELQECQNKSNAEISMLKSQLEARDMVMAEEDYLQRGDLSSLSILSQPAHSIVLVDAPDSSSSNGMISSSFDTEQCCWSKPDHQEDWLNVLKKRSHDHTCSQRCRYARKSGNKELNTHEEAFIEDSRPHVVVIDDLPSSRNDGHFQRKSNRIWGKRSSQKSTPPMSSSANTRRGKPLDKPLHRQQLSSSQPQFNIIPKTRPFSVVIEKMSQKDIQQALSDSTSGGAECIKLKATKKTHAQTVRNKQSKKQSNGDGTREMVPAVTSARMQNQPTGPTTPHVPAFFGNFSADDLINGTGHSEEDLIGKEINHATSPREDITHNFMLPFSPEDSVPVRGLHKKRTRVLSDTIEETPSKMDDYLDTPSIFSPEDFVPVRELHRKRTGVISDTMEETLSKLDHYLNTPSILSPEDFVPVRGARRKHTHVIDETLVEAPRQATAIEPSVNYVCLRSQSDALNLKQKQLLEEKPESGDGNQSHRSAEQLPPEKKAGLRFPGTKLSDQHASQGLQSTSTSVVFKNPLDDATALPCKKPKMEKEALKKLVWQTAAPTGNVDDDITSHTIACQKTSSPRPAAAAARSLLPPPPPPPLETTISKRLLPKPMLYGESLDKPYNNSIISQMSLSTANSTFAQLMRKRKKGSHRNLSSTFLTDTFTDDDEVNRSKKGTTIKVNTKGFVAPRLKLSQREKSFF